MHRRYHMLELLETDKHGRNHLLPATRCTGVLDLFPLDGKAATAGVDLDELDPAGVHGDDCIVGN